MSVHKSRDVKVVYEELKIETIFCVPYSPQYNGIESYWFLLKQEFKKLILSKMMNKEDIDTVSLIKTSVSKVESQKIINCAKDGLN